MNILFIGDISASAGRRIVVDHIPDLVGTISIVGRGNEKHRRKRTSPPRLNFEPQKQGFDHESAAPPLRP